MRNIERYVCSAVNNKGKIVDISIFHNEYSVMEYRRKNESKNNSVVVSDCSGIHNVFKEERDSGKTKRVIPQNKKWSIKVQCLETEKTYKTIRDCSKDLGVSGYRIRRVLDTKEAVDGFHFIRVARQG